MNCCLPARLFPRFVYERDLGSARGFDFDLGKCRFCGKPWLKAYCVASSMGDYEPISREDAEAVRGISDPNELKAFMRRLADRIA